MASNVDNENIDMERVLMALCERCSSQWSLYDLSFKQSLKYQHNCHDFTFTVYIYVTTNENKRALGVPVEF